MTPNGGVAYYSKFSTISQPGVSISDPGAAGGVVISKFLRHWFISGTVQSYGLMPYFELWLLHRIVTDLVIRVHNFVGLSPLLFFCAADLIEIFGIGISDGLEMEELATKLGPQSKDGVNSFGGLGATLIDSLDTLFIMGLDEQFQKAKEKRFKDKEDERQFIAFALAYAYFGYCWSLKRTYKVWNASLEWRERYRVQLRAFKALSTVVDIDALGIGNWQLNQHLG
ncbi:hypothetical protein Scep_030027 [Stephania cephalantha]|uniref:Alpha-1,2-Mannosidase n=1 Tax=Stephania cephalantha TaxID=152367 RepID=A0AAP0DZ09_9MAGN